MRPLTPAKILDDQLRARAIMAQHTIRAIINHSRDIKMATLHPTFKYPSSFSRAIDASHGGAPVYAGHAGEGGLQAHSVGGIYPWAVVPYGSGLYAVHNHVTGQRTDAIFPDAEWAGEWAERFKADPAEFAAAVRFFKRRA